MNKNQRDKFVKKVEAKYKVAQIREPWVGKSEYEETEKPLTHIISQLEVLQTVASVPGVMLIPNTYNVTSNDDWMTYVTFRYGTSPVGTNLAYTGATNMIKKVENQFQTKWGEIIHTIGTEFVGNNNTGQALYEVTIVLKK